MGRKMSKSLGNGIDPLEVVEKYGADALRLSLTAGTAMGNDMRLYDEKVAGARNFVNKLWNAARYCLANLEGWSPPADVRPKGFAGRWILSRLERTIQKVKDAMERFEPGEAIGLITDFIWDEFCDWYIEISKEDLSNPDLREETQSVLWAVLRDSLALLHPFTPFVTEELWSHLPGRKPGKEGSLIIHPYPAPGSYPVDPEAEEQAGSLIEATKAIRNMRAEVNIPTGKKAPATIAADMPSMWENMLPYIQRLAWAEPLEVADGRTFGEVRHALVSVAKGAAIYLPLKGVIDIDKETARLDKAIEDLVKDIERTRSRLTQEDFLSKAPQEIIDAQRKRFDEATAKLETLRARVEMLRRAR